MSRVAPEVLAILVSTEQPEVEQTPLASVDWIAGEPFSTPAANTPVPHVSGVARIEVFTLPVSIGRTTGDPASAMQLSLVMVRFCPVPLTHSARSLSDVLRIEPVVFAPIEMTQVRAEIPTGPGGP